MNDYQSIEANRARSKYLAPEHDRQSEHGCDSDTPREGRITIPHALLGGHSLSGHGNSSARATITQQMQQTHGNRAVQRFMRESRETTEPPATLAEAPVAAPSARMGTMPVVQRSLLDDATSWAGENIGRNPLDMLGAAHGLNQVFGAQHTEGQEGSGEESRPAPSIFYQGLRSAESAFTGMVDSAAEAASQVPVLGSVANWGADFVGNRAQQVTGFLGGAGDLIGGVANMVDNPIRTLQGLQEIAESNLALPGFANPFRMAHAAYDVATRDGSLEDRMSDAAYNWLDPMESNLQSLDFMGNMVEGMARPYAQAVSEGRPWEAMGRLGFDVISNMSGAGEARTAEGASTAARTANVAREAEVMTGISRGAEGVQAVRGGSGAAHTPVTPGSLPHNAPTPQPVMQMPAVPGNLHPNAPQPPRWSAGPASTPGPSNPVMQMPAVPGNIHPGMPQPPRWQAGPVGTPPVSNPVRQMPAVPADLQAGMPQPPRWQAGPVGTPPVSNPAIQFPAYPGATPGASSAAHAATLPAVNPHAPTLVNPHAPTLPATPAVNPHAPTLVEPHAPTMERPAGHGGTPSEPVLSPGDHPLRNAPGNDALLELIIKDLRERGEIEAIRDILGGRGIDQRQFIRRYGNVG